MRVSFLIDSPSLYEDLRFPDGVTSSIEPLATNGGLSVLTCEMKGDGIDVAKELAEVRDGIVGEHARLLEDDPSGHFERRLYGLFATFERRLRELVTITLCSTESGLDVDLVDDFERIDFGRLFRELFVDEGFAKKAKDVVNSRDGRFEKGELLELLAAIPEKSLWLQHFGPDVAPTLVDSHGEIRKFRNDVMHSHRMDGESYERAFALLHVVNAEMAVAIREVAGAQSPSGFEKALANVLSMLTRPIAASEVTLDGVTTALEELVKVLRAAEPDGLGETGGAVDAVEESAFTRRDGDGAA